MTKTRCVCAKSLQSHLTLCDPMDCSPPSFSVRGIFQARTLKWVTMPSSRIFPTQGSNPHLLCLLHGRLILYHWASREAQVIHKWLSEVLFTCSFYYAPKDTEGMKEIRVLYLSDKISETIPSLASMMLVLQTFLKKKNLKSTYRLWHRCEYLSALAACRSVELPVMYIQVWQYPGGWSSNELRLLTVVRNAHLLSCVVQQSLEWLEKPFAWLLGIEH